MEKNIMKTVNRRFSETQCNRFMRYTYESIKSLYDVDVYDDGVKYLKNCKPCAKEEHHSAIEEHFGLRFCVECGRQMAEMEHNYGTDETCGNIQVCIQCFNADKLQEETEDRVEFFKKVAQAQGIKMA
jgi:hypothetical protein